MPKVGDRVIVQGAKVGGGRREGTLRKVIGTMIQVRWLDGSETLFAPGAGTVQFLPGNGKAERKAEKASKKKPAKQASKKSTKPAKPKAKSGKKKR